VQLRRTPAAKTGVGRHAAAAAHAQARVSRNIKNKKYLFRPLRPSLSEKLDCLGENFQHQFWSLLHF
jgi:hypothetical protein